MHVFYSIKVTVRREIEEIHPTAEGLASFCLNKYVTVICLVDSSLFIINRLVK